MCGILSSDSDRDNSCKALSGEERSDSLGGVFPFCYSEEIPTRLISSRSERMAAAPVHSLNWYAGWLLVLAAFVTGATLGLFFHRDDFWGGYDSFRRRIVRLGHIALAALGMMNVLYSLSPWPPPETWRADAASIAFIVGGVGMPAVCFLSGWRKEMRHLFFVPVTSLILAVAWTLQGVGT
jgi:hypothetical protein